VASPKNKGTLWMGLIFSVNSDLTNAEVEELIKQNADDLGSLGFDPYFGFGRINVERTVVAA